MPARRSGPSKLPPIVAGVVTSGFLTTRVSGHGFARNARVLTGTGRTSSGELKALGRLDIPVDKSAQQEEFSLAYIRAVATVAGYYTSRPEYDRDSVDLNIAAVGLKKTLRSPKLDLQAKCTYQNVLGPDTVDFPLPVNNYNDLREVDLTVSRILVVVLVPPEITEWLSQSENELALKRCGYWVSLRGSPDTPNTTTVTINIPRAQVFSPEALRGIMDRVDNGGQP